ncbi:DNA polymerase beta superfamily protein [Halalkalibacter kiskunsagensis]|uniref:DNA polymerase beta superfamily protein n=1 Tax=Halalkalibacter kiskunsagensis TaxID=1548599 RepID=A0ABV6KBQ5_9BACI
MERVVALKALVGSANYNLTTAESDKDYKVFVLPTFSDLYYSKVYTASIVGETIDQDYHDIRKLVSLFWKSNVNFVEVLFSSDVTINKNSWIKKSIDQIFDMKNEIAAMNIPYLYKACKGMYYSKTKYLEKGNEGTCHLVEQFGYDSKSAMHAYRIMDFIERFEQSGFKNFKSAIKYDDAGREFMIHMKNGQLTKAEYIKLAEKKMSTFEKLEKVYLQQPVNEDSKEKLENIIYLLVTESVIKELN